eukprot:CAMPEP_0180434450 /NCGR_PEP_ID=MMETSP1036_2-20121128/9961_1 /TAXON_ID=632150 /ORGANISM="Azadinium spinosum, Strain 3D9" /LENGTH=605 /DNA_ID=CAMNT_0022440323 /DNA_START=66 /DNA_END=1883 /DNA_ORIENTATION=+
MQKPEGLSVFSLQAGDVVDVFRRQSQDATGYFMVEPYASSVLRPYIGKTDGWTEGIVCAAWNIWSFDPAVPETWVEVRWTHRTWQHRGGRRFNTSEVYFASRVPPEQVRLRGEHSHAETRPALSLLHIRWGGSEQGQGVVGAQGFDRAKGPLLATDGGACSDNYIATWESQVFQNLGPRYEVISAFVRSSEELDILSSTPLRHLLRGHCMGALYFLWPISFQDGHKSPAYVERERLLSLMGRMEATGIPTRFPHPSHLYRVLASKEWTAQTCLHPLLCVPLTVRVARQAVACDPARAAMGALQALERLSKVRAEWGRCATGDPAEVAAADVDKVGEGVAKLGWSWEAMDVMPWRDQRQLQAALSSLAEQPGCHTDSVLVQEWVDFDVEMRVFVVDAQVSCPQSWRPTATFYTQMDCEHMPDAAPRHCYKEFHTYGREGCLESRFFGDEAALSDAERQAEVLVGRWLSWLLLLRLDFMIKRAGPGRAVVTTGELTELGGSFLGWKDGPKTVFGAVIRSCLDVHEGVDGIDALNGGPPDDGACKLEHWHCAAPEKAVAHRPGEPLPKDTGGCDWEPSLPRVAERLGRKRPLPGECWDEDDLVIQSHC